MKLHTLESRLQALAVFRALLDDPVVKALLEDGTYLEYPAPLTSSMSPNDSEGLIPGGRVGGMMSGSHPYTIDPATVTAVNVSGTRVELSDLEPVQEEAE